MYQYVARIVRLSPPQIDSKISGETVEATESGIDSSVPAELRYMGEAGWQVVATWPLLDNQVTLLFMRAVSE